MTTEKIFDMLYASNEPISGEVIASTLGITRIAVNKHIQKLRADGVNIESGRKGYMYIKGDSLTECTLASKLASKGINMRVFVREVDSTNTSVKQILSEDSEIGDFVYVAPRQTKGRGRLAREFVSTEGGIYMTLCYRPKAMEVTSSLNIVLLTGLCVAKVLSRYVDNITIKWPNDVFVGDKKICGILLESVLAECMVDRLILGIGVNINNAIPPELSDIATNLCTYVGEQSREDIIVDIVDTLCQSLDIYQKEGFEPFREQYEGLSRTIGREVTVTSLDGKVCGKAVGLSPEGYLLLEKEGKIQKIIVGDVGV